MSDAEHIEARASEWLMRRDAGEADEAPEFTAWLVADPRHRAAYLRLAAAWESTRQLRRLRPESSGVDPDLLAPRHSGFRPWGPLAFAATLALIALSALWWIGRTPGEQVYRTDVGGLSRVVLADGSTVTLNTDTELRVHLLPRRREVTLTRGEAHFTVAHDAKRPFEVSAGGRIVRAVGTAFDVELKEHSVTILVTEGRVAVGDADKTPDVAPDSLLSGSSGIAAVGAETSFGGVTLISAGESATADRRQLTVRPVSTTESSRRLAWQVGELSFQGETLKEAVAEFNRYNRRKLLVTEPAIAQLEIGGNFYALDEESFIAALQKSFGVRAKETAEGVELMGNQAEP